MILKKMYITLIVKSKDYPNKMCLVQPCKDMAFVKLIDGNS